MKISLASRSSPWCKPARASCECSMADRSDFSTVADRRCSVTLECVCIE